MERASSLTKTLTVALVACAVFLTGVLLPKQAWAVDSDVATRDELVAALNDANVSVINITQDIDLSDGDWTGVKIDQGRSLVVNGNGHSVKNMTVSVAAKGPNGSGVAGDGGSCDYYTGWIAVNEGTLEVNDLVFTDAYVDANPVTVEKNQRGPASLRLFLPTTRVMQCSIMYRSLVVQ